MIRAFNHPSLVFQADLLSCQSAVNALVAAEELHSRNSQVESSNDLLLSLPSHTPPALGNTDGDDAGDRHYSKHL